MDFLKKKMKDLLDDDDDKDKGKDKSANSNSYPYPAQQNSYSSEPQYHGAPPPQGPSAPYSSPPPLPNGWQAQFDQQSQRWYYVEQATGRTQWEMPVSNAQGPYAPPPPAALPPYPSHVQPRNDGQGTIGHFEGYHQQEEKKKKQDGGGVGKVLLAGAVGAVGGAWVGHELTEGDSDDEHRAAPAAAPAAAPPVGYAVAGDGNAGYGDPLYVSTAPVPDETADGSSVSSSDREELEERREELEEAQEAYDEQYEETYDD